MRLTLILVQRGDPLQVSLSMVPPNHTLLPPRNLEAEASGLLDRLLAVFQENSRYVGTIRCHLPPPRFETNIFSDAVLVDATLNSLSILIRARPHIANKILNVLLNFNPLKLANSPMTPKLRVMVKSMEKTTRSLLIHISKRYVLLPLFKSACYKLTDVGIPTIHSMGEFSNTWNG